MVDKLNASVAEASDMIGVSRVTLYGLIRDERLPSFKIGGRRLIPIEALRAWNEQQAGKPLS